MKRKTPEVNDGMEPQSTGTMILQGHVTRLVSTVEEGTETPDGSNDPRFSIMRLLYEKNRDFFELPETPSKWRLHIN